MIGQMLRNIRKIKKLTQNQLGKKINLAENTISNYENEQISISFETAIKFINSCDFDIAIIDKTNNKVYTIEDLSKEMDF